MLDMLFWMGDICSSHVQPGDVRTSLLPIKEVDLRNSAIYVSTVHMYTWSSCDTAITVHALICHSCLLTGSILETMQSTERMRIWEDISSWVTGDSLTVTLSVQSGLQIHRSHLYVYCSPRTVEDLEFSDACHMFTQSKVQDNYKTILSSLVLPQC